MKQPPRLMRDELSRRVYVITRYQTNGRVLIAQTKYDVTDDFNKLVRKRGLASRSTTREGRGERT